MHAEVSLSKYDTSSNNRPEIICSVLHTYVTSIQNVVANAFHIWKQRYRPVRIMYIGDTLISCVGLSREGGGIVQAYRISVGNFVVNGNIILKWMLMKRVEIEDWLQLA